MKCVSTGATQELDSCYRPTFWLYDLGHTKLKKNNNLERFVISKQYNGERHKKRENCVSWQHDILALTTLII